MIMPACSTDTEPLMTHSQLRVAIGKAYRYWKQGVETSHTLNDAEPKFDEEALKRRIG